MSSLREAVESLLDKWQYERADYPIRTNAGAQYAAAAVRLCEDELRATLAAHPAPDAETKPAKCTRAKPDIAIGTPVLAWPMVRTDQPLVTRTRTSAWQLAGGTWLVSVEGITGGIGLTHVDVLPAAPPSVPAGSEPVAYCAHCGKGLNPGDPLCDHTGGPTPIRCMAPGCDGEHVGEVTIPAGSDALHDGCKDGWCYVATERDVACSDECGRVKGHCGRHIPAGSDAATDPASGLQVEGDAATESAGSDTADEPVCCCESSPPEFGGPIPDRDCPIHAPVPSPAPEDEREALLEVLVATACACTDAEAAFGDEADAILAAGWKSPTEVTALLARVEDAEYKAWAAGEDATLARAEAEGAIAEAKQTRAKVAGEIAQAILAVADRRDPTGQPPMMREYGEGLRRGRIQGLDIAADLAARAAPKGGA